jgi:8-oxo-dGTP diphosphatase
VAAVTSPIDLVVVRAFVVRAGRVLLVRRALWDSLPGHWELPGGKVDAGEQPALALTRELREETGLVACGVPALRSEQVGRSPSGRTVLERVYGVSVRGELTLSDEHDDVVWHSLAAERPAPLTPAAALALG